jgi:AraC family transcriptional activator of pobA
MDNSFMESITIAKTKERYNGQFIDDDIILFDEFADVPLPNEPRRMDCIIVSLCTKGKAQYSVNTEKHLVTANDIIIINQGQITDDFLLSRDFNGIGLMISFDFFSEIVKGVHEISSVFLFSRTHPVSTLRTEEAEVFKEYYDLIKRKICDTSHHFRKDVVRSLLTTMLYDLGNVIYRLQQSTDTRQTRSESIFADFIKLLEKNFRSERRVGWYGQQLCITPKYLSETVKQISKRTPNEWIDNYVIMEIRVQLKNSTKSIKEIATNLHFPQPEFLWKIL